MMHQRHLAYSVSVHGVRGGNDLAYGGSRDLDDVGRDSIAISR